jgi:peptidoglycan/xylan/chitin deacetylase (PgdA/CDA1 family)
MAPTRAIGTDNPYARWSPIVTRPPLRWPNGATVAAAVVVCVEHMEWEPDEDSVAPSSMTSYGPYPRAFQITGVSRPEYGGRVGAFRLLAALDSSGITPTIAMDAEGIGSRLRLVDECLSRGAEFVGHGMALNRTLSEGMSEAAERLEIETSLSLVERATGRRPVGWLGSDYAESTRTVRLLGELGVRYVCDWPNDEQPYPLTAGERQMVALPVAVDLDDAMVQRVRRLPPARWARIVLDSLARLREDAAHGSGRLLILNLHAHISGQPFRIRYVEEVLRAMAAAEDVWLTTTGAIVDWYQSSSPRAQAD